MAFLSPRRGGKAASPFWQRLVSNFAAAVTATAILIAVQPAPYRSMAGRVDFEDLRGNIKVTVGTELSERRSPDSIIRLRFPVDTTDAVMKMLIKRYPSIGWAIVAWPSRSSSDNASWIGYMSGTDCNVDVPPPHCADIGGLLIESETRPDGRTVTVAVIFVPAALYVEESDRDDSIIIDYRARVVLILRMDCVDEPLNDHTDFDAVISCVDSRIESAYGAHPAALIIGQNGVIGHDFHFGGISSIMLAHLNLKAFLMPHRSIV